jgi:hypothetical protein
MSRNVQIASIILGCIIGSLILITIFPSEKAKDTKLELSIITDKTDSFKATPNIGEIRSILDLEEYKWKQVDLRIQTLTNVDYNYTWKLVLIPRVSLFSNPIERDHEINAFQAQVSFCLDSISRLPKGLPKSTIYPIIVAAANNTCSCKRSRHVIIVYSDLNEHSGLFNVYRRQDLQVLQSDMNKVRQRFEAAHPPTNLTGLKLYLIYQPKGDEDSRRFVLMAALYKTIFEGAGAEVFIGANITS